MDNERLNMLRFFIGGAEAVMGDIGNGEECLDALLTIERDLETNSRLRAVLHDYQQQESEFDTRTTSQNKTRFNIDEVVASYNRGVNDGKAEASAENLPRKIRNMEMMLAHERVILTLKAGHAPFEFAPQYIMRYGGYKSMLDSVDSFIQYTPDTVGIVGINRVSLSLVFVRDYDSWTLAPPKTQE